MTQHLEKFSMAVRLLMEEPHTADDIAIKVQSKPDTVWRWLAIMDGQKLATVCGTKKKPKGTPGKAPFLWTIRHPE